MSKGLAYLYVPQQGEKKKKLTIKKRKTKDSGVKVSSRDYLNLTVRTEPCVCTSIK